jgi:hypothetical protein
MKIVSIDGEEFVDRDEVADELAEDYAILIRAELARLKAELAQAFDAEPEKRAAVLRVLDEQLALADAQAAEAIAQLRYGERH